jgi:hypothetical protein
MGKIKKIFIQYIIHRYSTKMLTKAMQMVTEVKVMANIKAEGEEEK